MPIPEGTIVALAEKLRKLRRFLLDTPTGTYMDLLKKLEPVLFVKYRFARAHGDPWTRFKAVDQAGFKLVAGDMMTMFDTRTTMTSLLRKATAAGTAMLAGEVQAGRQCSPRQALIELEQVERDWQVDRIKTWKLLKWIMVDEYATEQAARKIPADVVEAVLEENKFSHIPPEHQQRFISVVAKKAATLTRVTLRGFSALKGRQLFDVTGPNITVLKLIDCLYIDPCAPALGGCILADIVKKCTALECLEIRGMPALTVLADVGRVRNDALRFRSLKIVRVSECARLKEIWLSSAVEISRLLVQGCLALKSVRLEETIQADKCSFEGCPQLLSHSFELDFLKSKRFFGTQFFLFLFKPPIIIIIMPRYQKTSGSQPKAYLKLVLVGDCNTGAKSSLMRRFVQSDFTGYEALTIGEFSANLCRSRRRTDRPPDLGHSGARTL